MPGYDLIATDPDANMSDRLSVKSRWRTMADGFIIKNFDCDFVVVVRWNRGSKDGRADVMPSEFFVLPVDAVRAAPRTKDWGKVRFTRIQNLEKYRDDWDLLRVFLDEPR